MSLVYIQDMGGQTMPVREYANVNVRLPCVFPEGIFEEIPKLKLRTDDVFIATWMRSGTHWMFEMVNMLFNNSTATVPKEKRDIMLECQPISVLDELESPRVINTHLYFRYLPEDFKTQRCKVIYLMRDPRDAAVSWYKLQRARDHFEYKGEFHNWLPLCLRGELQWGSWFDHVRDWEKVFEEHSNLDVHFWFYENMKKNPVGELRKVAEFLGTNREESLLEAIVDKCQLDKMRTDKSKYDFVRKSVDVHYVTGVVGGWKKIFTVQQYEEFEKLYREKMAGSKFVDRYKGPVEVL